MSWYLGMRGVLNAKQIKFFIFREKLLPNISQQSSDPPERLHGQGASRRLRAICRCPGCEEACAANSAVVLSGRRGKSESCHREHARKVPCKQRHKKSKLNSWKCRTSSQISISRKRLSLQTTEHRSCSALFTTLPIRKPGLSTYQWCGSDFGTKARM